MHIYLVAVAEIKLIDGLLSGSCSAASVAVRTHTYDALQFGVWQATDKTKYNY